MSDESLMKDLFFKYCFSSGESLSLICSPLSLTLAWTTSEMERLLIYFLIRSSR